MDAERRLRSSVRAGGVYAAALLATIAGSWGAEEGPASQRPAPGVILEAVLNGPLAGCEDVREVAEFPWPDPGYLDFDACLAALRSERLVDPPWQPADSWAIRMRTCDVALSFLRSGLCVLPADAREKRPTVAWKE